MKLTKWPISKHSSEVVKKTSCQEQSILFIVNSKQAWYYIHVVFFIFNFRNNLVYCLLSTKFFIIRFATLKNISVRFATIKSIKVRFFIYCPILSSNHNFLSIPKKLINLVVLEATAEWNIKLKNIFKNWLKKCR